MAADVKLQFHRELLDGPRAPIALGGVLRMDDTTCCRLIVTVTVGGEPLAVSDGTVRLQLADGSSREIGCSCSGNRLECAIAGSALEVPGPVRITPRMGQMTLVQIHAAAVRGGSRDTIDAR